MTGLPPRLLVDAPRRERPQFASGPRHGRVLVVEDDPVQATLLSLMLARLDVPLLLVTDGEQAVNAVAAERFRLVLMDCLLPVSNGIEATRHIRHLEHEHGRERVPIVAVTASVMRSECEAYLAAGMDDVVSKPFTAQSLADALSRHGALAAAGTVLSPFIHGVIS